MDQENDIQSFRRLLNEIAEMCEGASLTGSLSGGAKRTVQRYNSVLNHLVEQGRVPKGLFSPLPEDSGYGEIGVEAKMLAGYFPSNKDKSRNRDNDDNERSIIMRLAPFVGSEDLAVLIREQAGKGMPLDMNTISNLAPFLGRDMLGELIRGQFNKESAPSRPEKPAAAPQAPEASTKPDYKLEPVSTEKESVADLLNLLKSPYLSDAERNELVEKLRAATNN